MSTVLAAEWIFPVTGPPLFRHAVEIAGGRIAAIRPVRNEDPYVNGCCLLPGFINAHTHLAYTAFRNAFDRLEFFPWIRKVTETKYQMMSDRDFAVSTRLGIAECLQSGITTVADMSDVESGLRELSESPLRGIFYWEIFGVEKDQAEQSWIDLQKRYPRLVDNYERQGLKIGVSPHACYTVRPELYRKTAEWATAKAIPVSFHLAESREEEEFITRRTGIIQNFLEKRAADWTIHAESSTAHLEKTGIFETRPLLAHLVQVTPRDVEILAAYDVSVAHCPKSNAKFGHGIAPVADLDNHGFRIGLGTDSAASNNRLDLFEEARFALLQQRARAQHQVLSEQRMLEFMTIDGAKALRMEHEIGSIEPGKQADLVMVRVPSFYTTPDQVLSHLIHNSSPKDVMKTVIAGVETNPQELEAEVHEIYRKFS